MYFILENKPKPFYTYNVKGRLSPTPHVHNHIEIVLVHDCGAAFCYADDNEVLLEPGDLFIAFPNQIHYYINKTPLIAYSLLIVSPDMCPEFRQTFHSKLPQTPILKQAAQNPRIVSALQTLEDCNATPDAYAEPLARGSLLVLLSEILKAMELTEHKDIGSDYAKEIIQYCYQNFDTDISLQSIADALHISRYYISHLFNQRLHVGFNDYINHLRIGKACELLKTKNQSITDIAYAVGYNSTRSFDRCFLAQKGMSPRAYREQKSVKSTTK